MRLIPDKVQLALDRKLTLADLHRRVADLRGDGSFLKLHEPLAYTGFPANDFSLRRFGRFRRAHGFRPARTWG